MTLPYVFRFSPSTTSKPVFPVHSCSYFNVIEKKFPAGFVASYFLVSYKWFPMKTYQNFPTYSLHIISWKKDNMWFYPWKNTNERPLSLQILTKLESSRKYAFNIIALQENNIYVCEDKKQTKTDWTCGLLCWACRGSLRMFNWTSVLNINREKYMTSLHLHSKEKEIYTRTIKEK